MRAPEHWTWREGVLEGGPAVVVDIDGVLSDAASRQHYLEAPRPDWRGFFDACGDDAVIDERYYEPRTAHGSTLSRVVHSWVLARRDRARSWDLFVEALYSDIEDIQGGTTKEGIHLGAMAGTVDLVQRCYTGLRARRAYLQLDPVIPPELGRLGFSIRYQGHLLHLDLATDQVRVNLDPADHGLPITLRIRGEDRVLGPGQSVEVALEDEAADAQPAP